MSPPHPGRKIQQIQSLVTNMVTRKNKRKGGNSDEGQAKVAKSLTRPAVSDLIAERLRMFYEDISRQPVPDRFLELLKKLEATDPKEGGQ